jgi:hypothetical protein
MLQRMRVRLEMQTNRRFTLSLFPCALLLAGAAVPANADTGSLPIGSSYCTAQVQSKTGATFSGGTGQSPVTLIWNVTAATTAGGAGTTLFTSKVNTLEPTTVKATPAGTYFYRVCIENSSKMVIGFGLYIDPAGPASATVPLVYGGAAEAVLGPGGYVCQGFSEGPAYQVDQSNVPVEWYVELFDGDGDLLGDAFTTLATSVNDIVSPISGAFYIDACANNTSKETAMLSLLLTPQ